MRKTVGLGVVGFLVITLLVPSAWPQEKFPSKPVTFECYYAAGGDSDAFQRILAMGLEKKLGVPVPVINIGGAQGLNGLIHTYGEQGRSDGHTLGYISQAFPMYKVWGSFPENAPDIMKDCQFLGLSVQQEIFLLTRADSKYKTFDDVIKDCKARPGQVQIITPNIQGTAGIAALLLKEAAGIDFKLIVGGGSATSTLEVLSGRVPLYSAFASVGVPYFGNDVPLDKRLKPLVAFTEERVKGYPDVPTARECGFDVVNLSLFGTAVHKATPKDRVQILTRAVKDATYDPDTKERLEKAGFTVRYRDPEETRAIFEQNVQFAKKLMQMGAIGKK